MEKGIKKGHPLPTKVVDEPSYKRPLHGFCYTHFNMKSGKALKVWDLDLQTLSVKAENVQALARTLNKALQSEQLDTKYITDVVEIMENFAIDIVNKVGEIEAEQ